MKQIINEYLASAIVNGNEVRLVTRDNGYFIHWGESDKPKAIKKITTPTGRKISQNVAHKRFLEAVKAAQYLKFERL